MHSFGSVVLPSAALREDSDGRCAALHHQSSANSVSTQGRAPASAVSLLVLVMLTPILPAAMCHGACLVPELTVVLDSSGGLHAHWLFSE